MIRTWSFLNISDFIRVFMAKILPVSTFWTSRT